MKYFLVAIMLVGCLVSCEQKAQTTSVSTSGIGKTVKKNTNKQKLVDALNEAEIAYRNAKSRDELNAAENILKKKAGEIQGQCTINELKEIEKDKLYIDAWNKCLKAYEKTADALGLFDDDTEVPYEVDNMIRELYSKYVFNYGDDFPIYASQHCSRSLIQRLKEECYFDSGDDDCYAVWLFRTGNDDGDSDENRILSIERIDSDWYMVEFIDMGIYGYKFLKIIQSAGTYKIDWLTDEMP